MLAAWQLPRGRLTRSRMSQPVDEGELCEIVEEMWEAAVEDSERRAALEATASTGLLARSLQAFEAVEQDSKAFCSLLRCAGVAEAPRAIELILQEALWRFGALPPKRSRCRRGEALSLSSTEPRSWPLRRPRRTRSC